jgi:hypothetical protein
MPYPSAQNKDYEEPGAGPEHVARHLPSDKLWTQPNDIELFMADPSLKEMR